jgi:hypothetical protein
MVPDVAVTVTEPCFMVVTIPVVLTVARALFDVDHVTLLIVLDEPSEYCPVAEYCCVSPAATVVLVGEMVMD